MVESNQNVNCGASSNILALRSRHSFTVKLFENIQRRKTGVTLLGKRKESCQARDKVVVDSLPQSVVTGICAKSKT